MGLILAPRQTTTCIIIIKIDGGLIIAPFVSTPALIFVLVQRCNEANPFGSVVKLEPSMNQGKTSPFILGSE
jgi:hypothetical protein